VLKLNRFQSCIQRMRSFSSFAVVVFTCLAFVSLSFGQTFSAVHGKLSTKGGHFVDKNGQDIQLHGMAMYPWTDACGYVFYNHAAINSLVASPWHCTAIRLPYLSSIPVSDIDTVVQACIDNGIYCIVDWHSGGVGDTAAPQAFFKTLATAYHSYVNIMYEPWNEPSGVTWAQIKPYMESVIHTIRAIDTGNIIICGNPNWDQEPNLAAADPITDATNIAYSMHFYAASHPEASFGPGITTAMNDGCAIFITEYGTCNASGGSPISLTATQTWYDFLDKNKIGSTNWGVECQDEGGAACFTQAAGSLAGGPWPSSDMTSEGLFVQNYIDTSYHLTTGVLPSDESKFQQRANGQKMNGLLTGAEIKSAAVYTINGVRCPAGSKLPNGLYIVRDPAGNSAVTGLMMR